MINFLKKLKTYFGLLNFLALYFISKKNYQRGYQLLIRSFCFSQGKSNDIISTLVSMPNTIRACFQVEMVDTEVAQAVKEIKQNGYYVTRFDAQSELFKGLIGFTSDYKCHSRSEGKKIEVIINTLENFQPLYTRYDYQEEDLVNDPQIQNFISQPFFCSIAKQYLGTIPQLDVTSMWWHFPVDDNLDVAAQEYHFDMDRVKWLKVFVYLSDVDDYSGPHCFIKGTHISKNIPTKILEKGYVRIKDDEIANTFGIDNEIIFKGKQGTIIIEDTRGLHKGLHPINSSRLLFQYQFSNCLFGTNGYKSRIYKMSESFQKAINCKLFRISRFK